MKNSMLNFGAFALNRNEMKSVVGGSCHVRMNDGTVVGCYGCEEFVKSGLATNWCCASCSTASWCKGC